MEAWFLAYPDLMLEKRFSSGLQIAVGTGLPGAACADSIFGDDDDDTKAHTTTSETRKSVFTGNGGFMGGIWYTINSGISFPIAHKIMFTERFDVIAHGIQTGDVIAKNWFYNPGVITYFGLTFAL